MEYVTLNNGVQMPQVGLGTFLIPENDLENTIVKAYELGYRKFDTAWRYYNEKDIADILKRNGIDREEVFLTTKVNMDAIYRGGYKSGIKGLTHFRSRSIKAAVEESFSNLDTDYIDLFLVHFPCPKFLDMWKVLEEYYKAGRIRAIGVSSFLPPHLCALEEISDIVPAVNQFEISPLNTQKMLINYCQERGIAVEAMSTFSHFRSNEPRLEIIENEQIRRIADEHKKSSVQIVLRWMVQRGIAVIPKTWDENYLKENISLFDFSLSDEEMAIIDSLDTGKCLNYNPYVATRGLPIKYKDWEGFADPQKVPEWHLNRSWWRKLLF